MNRRTFRYTVYIGEEMSVSHGDVRILYTDKSTRRIAVFELTEILVGLADDWDCEEPLVVELHMIEVGVNETIILRNELTFRE